MDNNVRLSNGQIFFCIEALRQYRANMKTKFDEALEAGVPVSRHQTEWLIEILGELIEKLDSVRNKKAV